MSTLIEITKFIYNWIHKPSGFDFDKFCINFVHRKGIQIAHWGACTNLTVVEKCGGTKEACPDDVASDVPVCGSDGNVYRLVGLKSLFVVYAEKF